jgi:hypothetical protein
VIRAGRAAAWLIGGACLAMLAFWVVAIGCAAAFDYGEGDTATWIWLLRHGQPIYGRLAALPMVLTNYPPFHMQATAWLAPSDALILPTGRTLAMLGVLLTASMVGLSARAATGSRKAGIWAALLFIATQRVGYYGGVCRGDAVALGLGATAVTLASLRVRFWWLFAAALFAVGALTKHSIIVFPVALGLWGLRRAPRQAIALGVLTFVLAGLLLWKLQLVDPLFVWSRAPWSLRTFLLFLLVAVAPSSLGIALVALALRRWKLLPGRAQEVLEPWVAVFGVGLLWIVSLGRTGAGTNYVLELCASIAVISVVVVESGAFRRLFLAHVAVTAAETIIYVACLLAFVLPRARVELAAAHRTLSGVRGPVFAEQSWLTTSDGMPPLVIPFLSTQLAASRRWDPAPLVELLDRGGVERLYLDFPLENGVAHPDRYLHAELAAMRAHYVRVEQAGDLYIYRPRP